MVVRCALVRSRSVAKLDTSYNAHDRRHSRRTADAPARCSSVFLLLTIRQLYTHTHTCTRYRIRVAELCFELLALSGAGYMPDFRSPVPAAVSPGAARTSTREDAEPPHTRCTARHDTPADMDTRHIIRIRALSLRERGQGYVRRVSPSHRPVLLELNISPQPAFTPRHARLLPSSPLDAAS